MIGLIHLPYAPPLMPSPALSYLGNYLTDRGFEVELIDINTDLYHSRRSEWTKTAQFIHYIDHDASFKMEILQYLKGMMAYIKSRGFTHIGVACYDSTYSFLVPFLTLLRSTNPEVDIILGGPDTTENPDRYRQLLTQSCCTHVVLKEGEMKILAILNESHSLPKGIITPETLHAYDDCFQDQDMLDLTTDRTRLKTLWNYDQLYGHTRLIPLYTSRGCPGQCSYCAHKIVWDGYRQKPVEQVIDEMNDYRARWSPKGLYFTDMLMNGDADWFKTFIHQLKQSPTSVRWSGYLRVHPMFDESFCNDLVEAGCSYVFFGVESAAQSCLNRLRKGTRVEDNERTVQCVSRAGLFQHISLMMGIPEESMEDMIQTIEFVRRFHWEMDHVEIYRFENFPQSSGYSEHLAYYENEDHRELINLKNELYEQYIVPFNQLGSGMLNLGILYHPKSRIFKQAINRYFELRQESTLPDKALEQTMREYPDIRQDNGFTQSLDTWYDRKCRQLELLDRMIVNCTEIV